MLALVGHGGFLRRDQVARQTHRLFQLPDGQIMPDKIFKVSRAQAFRLQNLFYKGIQRHAFSIDS